MNNEFQTPHFEFKDLQLEDLRDVEYVDPYYHIRRPIEPSRLKLIYQQAFIYDLLYKFAKEHLPDITDRSGKKDAINTKSTDTTVDLIKEKVLDYLFNSQLPINPPTESNKTSQPPAIDNIWTETDLDILRRNWLRTKEENMMLKSQLKVNQDELIELREKFERLQVETKLLPGALKSMEQENERLYIRVRELETRYETYTHELTSVDNMIGKMRDDEVDLKARVRRLQAEKSKLEFELNKCRHKLKLAKLEFAGDFGEKCEKVKIEYELKVNKLERSLNELNLAFKQELVEHDKAKKALEHLRTHFMTNFVKYDVNNRIDQSKIKIV